MVGRQARAQRARRQRERELQQGNQVLNPPNPPLPRRNPFRPNRGVPPQRYGAEPLRQAAAPELRIRLPILPLPRRNPIRPNQGIPRPRLEAGPLPHRRPARRRRPAPRPRQPPAQPRRVRFRAGPPPPRRVRFRVGAQEAPPDDEEQPPVEEQEEERPDEVDNAGYEDSNLRSAVIYPNIVVPQSYTPGQAAIYEGIREGFDYREGTGFEGPENPAGRTTRAEVRNGLLTSGTILGQNDQPINIPNASYFTIDELYEQLGGLTHRVGRRDLGYELYRGTFAGNQEFRVRAPGVVGGAPIPVPDVYGQDGLENEAHYTVLLIAQIITFVCATYRVNRPVHDMNVLRRNPPGPIRTDENGFRDLLLHRTRFAALQNIQLVIVLELTDQFPGDWDFNGILDPSDYAGKVEMVVNKYNPSHLNPEYLKLHPGGTVAGLGRAENNAVRTLTLNSVFSNLDIFLAVYRALQLLIFHRYVETLDVTGFRIHMIRGVHLPITRYRAPGANEIFPWEAQLVAATFTSTKNIQITIGNETYKVRFPITSHSNCFFAAIREATTNAKYTSCDASLESRYLEDVAKMSLREGGAAVSGFKAQCMMARTMLRIPQASPINIKDQETLKAISQYYNVQFRIYNTSMELISECMWDEKKSIIPLIFFTSEEMKAYSDCEPSKYEEFTGHIGVLLFEEKPLWCKKCRVLYKKTHTCTKASIEHNKPSSIRERFRNAYYKYMEIDKNNGLVTFKRPDFGSMKRKKQMDTSQYVIYYDFETLVPEKDKDEFQVYAVGFSYRGKYKQYCGRYCLDYFLEFLFGIWVNAYVPIRLCAWNSCRFDAKIILRRVLTSPKWKDRIKTKNLLIANNRLLNATMTFTGRREHRQPQEFEFFDPCLFFSGPLKDTCVDFNVNTDIAKKSFPHKLMTSYESLDETCSLETLNDVQYYYGGDLKNRFELAEPWTTETLAPFMMEDGKYSLRKLCGYYLEKDVASMQYLCETFFSRIFELEGNFDPWFYMTISHLSYSTWLSGSPYAKQLTLPMSYDHYDHIRACTYGGRVFVGRKEWKSPLLYGGHSIRHKILEWENFKLNCTKAMYNELPEAEKECFNTLKFPFKLPEIDYHQLQPYEYVVECDFYSLYPSVMCNEKYPIGKPTHTEKEGLAAIQKHFNETGEMQYGMYRVTYETPNDLYLSPLPHRGNGELNWHLGKFTGWYTSVDLENAYLCGVKVELHEGYVYDRAEYIFKDFITNAVKMKKEGDDTGNGSLRRYAKLLMNSLYGKMLQSVHKDVSSIVSSSAEVQDFMEKYVWEGAMHMGESLVMTGVNPKPTFTKPHHLGSFVLAYSRRYNLKAFIRLVPTLLRKVSYILPNEYPPFLDDTDTEIKRDILKVPIYGDTDSMYMTAQQTRCLDLRNELGYLKNEDEEDYLKKKKKGKDGGVRILWMIALSVKTYAYVYIDSGNNLYCKIASKGINTKKLNFTDFMDSIENIETYEGRQVDLGKSIRGQMSKSATAETFSKIHSLGLKRTFNKTLMKTRVCINENFKPDVQGIYTVPRGHKFAPGYEYKEDDPEERDEVEKDIERLSLVITERKLNNIEEEVEEDEEWDKVSLASTVELEMDVSEDEYHTPDSPATSPINAEEREAQLIAQAENMKLDAQYEIVDM